MSVESSKRGHSDVQYLETARQIEVFTLVHCVKWPRRYYHLLTERVVLHAVEILDNCKAANSIFVGRPKDGTGGLTDEQRRAVAMRLEYLTRANVALQQIISQLDAARELFKYTGADPVKDSVWCQWFALLNDEAKLIAGVKKSIRERFNRANS